MTNLMKQKSIQTVLPFSSRKMRPYEIVHCCGTKRFARTKVKLKTLNKKNFHNFTIGLPGLAKVGSTGQQQIVNK